MSKKNIFIVTLFALIFTASFVTADYVGPASSPPNSNTPPVLKTESENSNNKDFLYEKIGTGNGNLYPALSQLANGSYFGVTENGQAYGLFSDKSVVVGNTIISDNFDIKTEDETDPFDQYTNQFTYTDFATQTNKTAKKIEALINGILFSKVSVANDIDASNSYSLELSTLNNTPTTNVGLGNTCKLYPLDIGSTIGAFNTGCPEGSYVSMYKNPSFSGPISSTNNTNNQVVAQCTYFKPSASPTNNSNCYGSGIVQSNVTSPDSLAFHGGSLIGYYSIQQISPGNCVLKARIPKNQLKNPTITIKESSSPNVIFGTSSVTQIDSLPVSCTQPAPDFVVMDGYGQYYTNVSSISWNDPIWGYLW